MSDEFSLRAYLLSIVDPEERARAIHEGGWAGDPEIADIEAAIALPEGGEFQKLLAAQRRPRPDAPKRAVQRLERLRAAWPERYGPQRADGAGSAIADTGTNEGGAVPPPGGAGVKPPGGAVDSIGTVATGNPKARGVFRTINLAPPEPGSLSESIGRYVYENQRSIWPHKKGEVVVPKPIWYGSAATVAFDKNPFLPPRRPMRSSDLTGEDAVRLYTAIAFSMWRYGAIMTAHVVILWETFRVYEHERATKILSDYLGEAKKWAAVGTAGQARKRRRQRTGEGFKFRYVYAHENGTERGFHTHILCTVPGTAAKAFEAWSLDALARLTRWPGHRRSVRVRRSYGKNEIAAVTRCWNWFRYIAKQLDPNAGWSPRAGRLRPLRDILNVRPHRSSLPVSCAQLASGSQNIWTRAQNDAGFVSRLELGQYDQLYVGHELDGWRQRCASEELGRTIDNLEF